MTDEKNDTVYKPSTCYACGSQMGLFTMQSTWKMRIAGELHSVKVFGVPCEKCLNPECDICILSGCSDEAIQWCTEQYLDAKGLNTRWHKLRRWIRRRVLCYRDRWNYWVFKTFYKKDERNAA